MLEHRRVAVGFTPFHAGSERNTVANAGNARAILRPARGCHEQDPQENEWFHIDSNKHQIQIADTNKLRTPKTESATGSNSPLNRAEPLAVQTLLQAANDLFRERGPLVN